MWEWEIWKLVSTAIHVYIHPTSYWLEIESTAMYRDSTQTSKIVKTLARVMRSTFGGVDGMVRVEAAKTD